MLFFGCGTAAASDLGIRVLLGGEIAPGIYGEVEIGTDRPRVFYPEPVIIHSPRRQAPVYLHVPPGHARKWDKHCGRYNACDVPVYFIVSREYEHEPEYANVVYVDVEVHDDDYDHHDNRGNDDRSNGNRGNSGKGKGKGNGHH